MLSHLITDIDDTRTRVCACVSEIEVIMQPDLLLWFSFLPTDILVTMSFFLPMASLSNCGRRLLWTQRFCYEAITVQDEDAKSIDRVAWQIREVLKKRFFGSAREAFESLDIDRDGKLSQQDLEEGLKKVCIVFMWLDAY